MVPASLRSAVAVAFFGACVASCGSCGAASSTPPVTPTVATTATPTPIFGSPSASTSASATPGPNGGVYTVQVSATGSDAVEGAFTATLAAGSAAHCPAPNDLSGTIAGTRIELQMPQGSPVNGQPQQLSPGDIQFTVGNNVWGVASAANAPHPSSGTLQRNSDGSGSASFQNLALQSDPSRQPQESGSVTWTCG